ncbi:MAG: hypothetical protein A2700_03165 [Candidatus Blackburnbacteria bacterium RIFCSPHIGHO2_01_FULL_44_64]|uniref:Peptidase A2 domain-containing protein n=1 Tax=Candidatus Blackburnbacteria bacterium RIFCSPHIGHO2_02_FULL_44_20 TaxID=1797516 RepID=A0A1G1VA55_9BACT|nr:MAG: hypothetical protein A2700_03165 [Candidatus Blackburnbacteria bacterium RIFCSPHIGHO2_01_FULL_44_64]OGY11754.1 MAG: hypothetical protein A3E16_03050 [Candidatus Blackburnbacteria bacterium RIFCSPHIGHO2_12_FULL_44_25]OGY12348.1 MAG: hypothetical protein A3D26_01840 [Candidatus Blackburnbacteria bacterium RIFCSPHIGHO2_02_FULL_44_20]OGY15991.1 MAG: hypothetical protein A3H88_00485 [Candidatus Blackburnbacteria bacterium RIFCSPLOWO2_02_FULL_44_9]
MNFPYLVLPGGSLTPRPLLPVTYKYKDYTTKDVLALVDSGADYSFASLRMALELGIKLKGKKQIPIRGFSGSVTECFPEQLFIRIAGREVLTTIYFGGPLTHEFIPIIGQETFFDKAKITFERYKQAFSVEWRNKPSKRK